MSFYVSESLKGRVTEDEFLEGEEDITKSNFSEKLYLEIVTSEKINKHSNRVYVPVTSITQTKSSTTVQFSAPEDADLFREALEWIKHPENVCLFIASSKEGCGDINIFSFKGKTVDITEVRQSLLGYNYLVTIVIDDCTVF